MRGESSIKSPQLGERLGHNALVEEMYYLMVDVYIYIYIERERETERERSMYTYICIMTVMISNVV